MCICPKCKFSFCASCRVEWHADATCAQYKQWLKDNVRQPTRERRFAADQRLM